jgi:branched-chain amino acid transport system ATP-binding protein
MSGAGEQDLGGVQASAPALGLRNVSKRFGGVLAVSGISFDVAEGSFTAIIGPNGAGKTTLFNLITNLFPLTEGTVSYFGRSLAGLRGDALAGIGLIRTFQTARVFPGMTALSNVKTGGHLLTRVGPLGQMFWTPGAIKQERALTAKAHALLELTGLSQYASSLAHELPIGAQKLVEIARALMASPRVLLLDEPAAGLNDSETATLATILRAICEAGITIVVVEHNMSLVMGADRVVVLDAGRLIAEGTLSSVAGDERVIEAYLGYSGSMSGAA